MKTLYIPLEEAKAMMKSHEEKLMGLDNGVIQMLLNDLDSLPSIDLSVIDTMINTRDSIFGQQELVKGLKELKSRLSPKN